MINVRFRSEAHYCVDVSDQLVAEFSVPNIALDELVSRMVEDAIEVHLRVGIHERIEDVLVEYNVDTGALAFENIDRAKVPRT